jgi:hypothetical protein
MNIPALDQSVALGVYSGVQVHWTEKIAERQDAGDPKWRLIETKPNTVLSPLITSSDIIKYNSRVTHSN